MKVKLLKPYFLYNSIDIVTILKDLYKIHDKTHKFLLSIKKKRSNFFKEGMQRVIFNPLPDFQCNGSTTVTSYCYLQCNEKVTISYKK
jgi:hypothetical protein